MKQAEINKLRRGKRSHKRGSWVKSIEADARSLDIHNSTDHETANGFGYVSNINSDCYETVEDHIVPRQSLTDKQNLRNNVRPLMGVVVRGCITLVRDGKTINTRDKVNPGKDIKITLMSDKTLLNQGNPFREGTFKRQSSKSKRIKFDTDTNFTRTKESSREISLDLDLDGKNKSYQDPYSPKKK